MDNEDAKLKAQNAKQSVCGAQLDPADRTDLGEAMAFAERFGDICRFNPATRWLVFDGGKWEENDLHAQALAQTFTGMQLTEARTFVDEALKAEGDAVRTGDKDAVFKAHEEVIDAKSYLAFATSRRRTGSISAILNEASPFLEIDVEKLDADPFLLNTPGGTVDLRTGRMRMWDPKDFCTKMTAVAPSNEGSDIWSDFLDRITCGDADLRDYLHVCSGMALIGKVFTENLMIAHGSGGNGKSTFFNTQYLVLGDYAGTLSSDVMTVNCRRNKLPELAELRGKRFVIASELEEGMRLDMGTVKKLCSTDPIRAEKKFRDPFDFVPSHTTILYTNHLPKVGSIDKGTWDRLAVVPFPAKLRGEAGEIKNYADYLFTHCGGAALKWMIEGAGKFIDAGCAVEQPKAVRDAVESYREDNDWLNVFLTECCETGEGLTERAGEVYEAYRNHCAAMNEYTRTAADFKSALVNAGFGWKRVTRGVMYYGLKLNQEHRSYSARYGAPPWYA